MPDLPINSNDAQPVNIIDGVSNTTYAKVTANNELQALTPNVVTTGTIIANGGTVTTTFTGRSALGIVITGVWSATLQFEGSVDGVNFTSIIVFPSVGGVGITNTIANGTWFASTSGLTSFRVRASAFTSGTVTISFVNSTGDVTVFTPGSALTGSVKLQDGVGNNITSTAVNGKQALDVSDIGGTIAESTAAWTSATALNTAVTMTVTGYTSVFVTLNQGTTITGGVVTFEVSDTVAFTNAYPVNASMINDPDFGSTYTLVASTNQGFYINVRGAAAFRIRLSTVITGTGTINVGVQANSLPGDPVISGVVNAELYDSAGTGVTLGQKTKANSIPVTMASDQTAGTTVVTVGSTLVTTTTTANQVVATYTVTVGKTLYLTLTAMSGYLTVLPGNANPVLLGAMSVETPAGTKIITADRSHPPENMDGIYNYNQAITVPSGTVIRIVVTPAAVTSTTWRGSILGYEQ